MLPLLIDDYDEPCHPYRSLRKEAKAKTLDNPSACCHDKDPQPEADCHTANRRTAARAAPKSSCATVSGFLSGVSNSVRDASQYIFGGSGGGSASGRKLQRERASATRSRSQRRNSCHSHSPRFTPNRFRSHPRLKCAPIADDDKGTPPEDPCEDTDNEEAPGVRSSGGKSTSRSTAADDLPASAPHCAVIRSNCGRLLIDGQLQHVLVQRQVTKEGKECIDILGATTGCCGHAGIQSRREPSPHKRSKPKPLSKHGRRRQEASRGPKRSKKKKGNVRFQLCDNSALDREPKSKSSCSCSSRGSSQSQSKSKSKTKTKARSRSRRSSPRTRRCQPKRSSSRRSKSRSPSPPPRRSRK